MKAILLAAGAGTRLYPASLSVPKPLLPIYDKPMIFYPLSVLMLSGIKDILLITSEVDAHLFKKLLADGRHLGINIQYEIQYTQNGIADALIIGEKFINNEEVALILSDNIFLGTNLEKVIKDAMVGNRGATVFGYKVNDPQHFGVVEFDGLNKVVSLEEKPQNPKSHYAVTGIYFYDKQVCDFAKQLSPSNRGELEITDLNKIYLENEMLDVKVFSDDILWLDTGTHDAVLEASNLIKDLERKTGQKIACLEEIAYRQGFISLENTLKGIKKYKNTAYYSYIRDVLSSVVC
ncbi:MAG: glucose-1-phosphate thymidylyltransferase RfbA [Holosporales bacterium]|jgi:glucose-1-phosphate thymidylyltransferase|nr:glucose-1-phosphate thymidylyltransferase RfbA [Holosporales bacterium]